MSVRRPSLATVIALVALFVALGGPAQAARLIGSAQIKDRSIKERDINRRAVRSLKTPRNGGVTASKLARGAVGSAAVADRSIGTLDLAPGSVGGAEIRAGAVDASDIADGTLDARDIGRFHGRFRVNVPDIAPGNCWAAEPAGLAPEQAGADISQDLVVVTPDSFWPSDRLAFTVKNSGNHQRFVLSGCNRTGMQVQAFDVGFRYLVIDLP